MQVYSIASKLDVTWNAEAKAIIDTWMDYSVSLEEFSAAILEHSLPYAKEHGGLAYIVDSSKAVGAFSDEIQKYIETDIFPAFTAAGIKFFVTINSEADPVTQETVDSYASKAGPNGLNLVELKNVDDAVMWLKVYS